MKVKDVMTSPVLTVGLDTPLKEAAELLASNGISGLPVVSAEGRVLGVFSEADILVKESEVPSARRGLLGFLLEASTIEANEKLQARTAGQAMSAPAITIDPNRSVTEAATLMLDERINRLPVVKSDGTLVGIVTRADLVRAFVRSDEEVANEIREDVIGRALWIEPDRVGVVVERGEVTLSGLVDSEATAELIPKFVQRVPGVVSVLSKLSWEMDKNGQPRQRRDAAWLAS